MTLEIQDTNDITVPYTAWFFYGKMGSGKTRAAATFPHPLFIVPANENSQLSLKGLGLKYVICGKRKNGQVVPVRQHLNEILTDLERMHAAMLVELSKASKAASEEEAELHYAAADAAFPYQTIVLESLSHLGDLLVEDVSAYGQKKMDQQGWGAISTFLRSVHSRLRNMQINIVYTALDKTQESESGGVVQGGPNMIGSAADKFPSGCDCVVYMETVRPITKGGPFVYRAHLRAHSFFQARTRFQSLPHEIDDFNFMRIAPLLEVNVVGAPPAEPESSLP